MTVKQTYELRPGDVVRTEEGTLTLAQITRWSDNRFKFDHVFTNAEGTVFAGTSTRSRRWVLV